jgi:riboflavin synthase alpha subunit
MKSTYCWGEVRLPSNIGGHVVPGDIVALIGLEKVRDIEKAINFPVLASVAWRECLKVIVEMLRKGNVCL